MRLLHPPSSGSPALSRSPHLPGLASAALRLAGASTLLALGAAVAAEPSPIPEGWDFAAPMSQVAARFTGKEGVVLHVGDSITYANPYSQWARNGKGRTPEDEAVCRWTHAGAKDETDGWHLCSVDCPGNRSETAASGMRADEALAGGKGGLPSLTEIVKKYNPRMIVLMLGTNDVTAARKEADYAADMAKAVDLILANGTIPILSTIPPHPGNEALARSFNAALRELAREKRLPLIDFEKEILARRPADWNGTLLGRNDVHPTAGQAAGEPTEENLKSSGYLLRGWLSVRKIGEVKTRVLDHPPAPRGEGKDLTPEERAERSAAERKEREAHDAAVKEAIDAFKKALRESKSVGDRVVAVRALGAAARDPKIVAEMARLSGDAESVRIAAMEVLATYRRDKAAAQALLRTIPLLLAPWEDLEKDKAKDGDIKKAAEDRLKEVEPALKEALAALTGQAFAAFPDVQTWWAENRRTFKPREDPP